MKPILDGNLPKFIMVNETAEKRSWNKHLLKPYKKGEIVRVAPLEKQKRNKEYDDKFQCEKYNESEFRKRFVVVYRKDEFGKFTIKYTSDWEIFSLLTKSKK